ncbi:TonB-dependent receptor [Terracidiphilus gabretensis]|uniref:TonB-dependent receptor n=1 Tax=Terracidiphilus gabretensis TaxID=1577687 RepID=UPI00071B7D21|nr:TonB-dependent receptor [Terracidiphilus gabretensis]
MRTIFWRRLFPALAGLLPLQAFLMAQAPGTGAIRGMVFDPAGRALPSAAIVIDNDATHIRRSVVTNGSGEYSVALLPPGNYSAVVRAIGFADAKAAGITIVVSETSTVDFHLTLASATTSVEVTANQELAQVESAALGRVVDEVAIQSLPLSNRNFTQILSLSPGVTVGLPDATQPGRGTQDVNANGSKTTANNIQFNGVDANNLSQNSAASDGEEVGVAVPAPDTIQEFKVQTGNYDATYGRGTGANVDLVSKSGTNRFHGTTWEFLRNDLFNASDFFSNLTGQPKPVLKQNQFGGAVGGPILHNRTFFFAAYQGLRSSNGEGVQITTLLPQLTNDRSAATLGAQFCAYPTSVGGTQIACNGSNINTVALNLLNFKLPNGQYAVPNPQILLPSTDPTQLPLGESSYSTPATYKEDQYTLDLDHKLTEKNSFAARLFYSRAPTVNPFSPNAANVPGWGTNEVDKNVMAVLSDTHVINSNLINVARAGYMRFAGISSVGNPISTTDLGTQSPTGLSGAGIVAPGISINGLFTVGDAGTPSQSQTTNSFIAQDMISLTRHNHFLRFGAEVKRHQVMVDAPFSTDGLLQIATFSDFLLGQSAQQNGSPSGQSNVTLSNGSSGIFRKDERYNDFAFFAQDDIKITPRLTVNAGLRYEIFGTPSEINGRLVTFDPSLATLTAPTTGTLSGFAVTSNFPGSVPTGATQLPGRGLWPTRFGDLSPRLGFAYRVTEHPEIVFRGGFGIYFDRLAAGLAENLVSQPPFSSSQFAFGEQNGAATLAAPFVPLLPSLTSYPIFPQRIPGAGPTVTGISTRIVDPYTEEYNANFQFGLGWNTLAEVGYVGTHSIHVAGCYQFNQSLLASPENPINGATTNSVSNVIQRVRYSGIAPSSLECQTAYSANYNSLQASVTKRISRGLQFLGSYTWSRMLDQTSGSSGGAVFELWLLTNDQYNPSYAPSDFDRTHRGVFNFTYDLPAVNNMSPVLRYATSHWQASGILVAQSGSPITVLDESAGAVYGNYSFESRAQLSGGSTTTSGSIYSRVIGNYLSAGGFTSAPLAPNAVTSADTNFGNSSVGLIRGPGQRDIDMAVERSFPFAESQSVHFRAEFFNLSNTPNFANPADNIINTGEAFGKITAKANNPRIIQFALKYQF